MSQMSQDNQYSLRLCDYLKRSKYVTSYTGLLSQLLQSPYPYTWKIISQLLTPLLTQNPQPRAHLLQLSRLIAQSLKKIKTLTLLFYVYELKLTYADLFVMYGVNWKFEYEDIGIQLGDLSILASWVNMHSQSQIVQDTLWLLIRNMKEFVKVEGVLFRQFQLNCVVEWIVNFQTVQPNTDRFIDSCQLIKLAKQTRIVSSEFSLENKKQHLLYRSILQICSQCKNPSPNIFLFIYPMPFMQNQIVYFCEIYSDFITDLSEEGLVNIFNAFTKGTLCKESLLFILKISHILANQQEFFKLRYLYQNYILPVLIQNGKSCNRVYQTVLQIASLYIFGFIKHCDIGQDGMKCVVNNIGKIKNQFVQNKWIQLCSSICNMYPDMKANTLKMLKKQLNKDIDLPAESGNSVVSENSDSVWEITVRNGRKHKKYNKVASKMLGIYNRNNQCYIISTVQGLLRVGYFQALLDKFKEQIKGGSLKLMDQFRILFGEVCGTRKTKDKISVSYLKRLSPQPFTKSQHQEDAYEFLIKIFEILQLELQKVPGMLQQFKQLFQIDEVTVIKCSNCKFAKQMPDKKYIVTVPCKNILSEINEEPLTDFKCSKCQQKGNGSMITKLMPKSKVLIVHINRFSQAKDGSLFKQLSTQRILRNFMNYELIGMVVHKGKKIDRGHYVYYHRLNPKRWALFNDNSVEEFELEFPFEQFQRQWKAQMAPYILFYRVTNDKLA